MSDWNPEAYARFRGLRLRPALDLLEQVGRLPKGDVIDLGCGSGAVGPALAARFEDRRIIGIDTSPAMLSEAAATGAYKRCDADDIAIWHPARPPALIFSNAALHWLPDHAALMPRLAALLPPGGVLAVQMPRQHDAPSHRLLRAIAAEMFPDRFDFSLWKPPVMAAPDYARLLAALGRAEVWESEYTQRLAAEASAHPVRIFTQSTAMRPMAEKLGPAEQAAFVARYEAALALAYPAEADGSVFMPFRRLFFVLTV
ncbi:MAG: methyltransferase domain-containing protein [Phaeovulum sp.]|uniref:methyltransferase domain-containing protein n=1 Tax=Phaeovulum sp. TaxID=2934796 RepID=UPI00272F804E|nr:methyltransferase domain-containing protein [Phaeovulum sp.]MDP2063686.1 methyltransferase domain-containing protein [Phaeovulum sp.]